MTLNLAIAAANSAHQRHVKQGLVKVAARRRRADISSSDDDDNTATALQLMLMQERRRGRRCFCVAALQQD
jgi:hypothetical protein